MTAKEKTELEIFIGENLYSAIGVDGKCSAILVDILLKYIAYIPQTEPTPHKPTKISELTENDVIHTKTEAEYYRISDLLTSANKKWRMGEKYGDISHWKYHKAKFCFWPSDGTRQDKKYYKKEGRNIIPSTQITEL